MTFLRLLLLPALLLLSGCGATRERWAEAKYANITYQDLYGVVQVTIDAEGYTARVRDVQTGRIESDWVYGNTNNKVRGPSRRKVFAHIDQLSGDEGYLVRVRVAEEVVRHGGLLATNPRESEDWEEWQDNFETAEYLMAKIAALLPDNRVSPDFQRRWGLPSEPAPVP